MPCADNGCIIGGDKLIDLVIVIFWIVLGWALVTGGSKQNTLDIRDGFIFKQVPTIGSEDSKTDWFDKLSKIWLFTVKDGKIKAQSFFLPSLAYKHYLKTGKVQIIGFQEYMQDGQVNQNVNVVALTPTIKNPYQEVIALAETPPQIYLAGDMVRWQDCLPKEKIWESAHPLSRYNGIYNYLISFSWPSSHYVFYKVEGKKRKIIAKICTSRPSYMHSFGETKNYLLLMETPLRMEKSYPSLDAGYIKNFSWKPEYQSKLFVVHKKTGKTVTFNAPPIYFYHSVNAYEEKPKKIVFDIIGQKGGAPHITEKTDPDMYLRYTIDLRSKELEYRELPCDPSLWIEFPVINEAYSHKHRYVYMVSMSTYKIVKYDVDVQKVVAKTTIGNVGEPIFIANKQGVREDDGYLFALRTKPAQLVVFDARNLKVVTKLHLSEKPDNIGLHGRFFPLTI